MVNPFQMQSMAPDESSKSFASHEMGWSMSSYPMREAASFARSMSNPVNSPSSPTYPKGGKSWSKPTVNVVFAAVVASVAAVVAAVVPVEAPEEQPISTPADITAANAIANIFFMLTLL